jgi:hypothetical protein
MVVANMTKAKARSFIPEIWSDEVIASYKTNLVTANLVRNLNHKGKKGDTIHIPVPGRSAASAKEANTQVSLNTDEATIMNVTVNEHFEWSMQIEDIASIQAMSSMRKFYTDDAGYALASTIDGKLLKEMRTAVTSLPALKSSMVKVTSGWDKGILSAIQLLNIKDVPTNNRVLIVSPSCMTKLISESRFTEHDKIGSGKAITTGRIGQIYGMDVYMSNKVAENIKDGVNNLQKANSQFAYLVQKESTILATQQSIRTQTQYKQEYLADLFTADCIFGVKVIRPESIVLMSDLELV